MDGVTISQFYTCMENPLVLSWVMCITVKLKIFLLGKRVGVAYVELTKNSTVRVKVNDLWVKDRRECTPPLV